MADQIGLEQTPDAFVAELVAVFREVKRVLRDDGTLWLNLGDSYARNAGPEESKLASLHTMGVGQKKAHEMGAMRKGENRPPEGLKPKDLIGIPWRVAFALQADGWYLRQDIIWHKPNPMPESVKDRCTKAHEYIFLLSKSERYYYDADAISEPYADSTLAAHAGRATRIQESQSEASDLSGAGTRHGKGKTGLVNGDGRLDNGSRNRRSVWTVPTAPYKGAHFATFPPDLIEPCIKAGTSQHGACAACGAPWERETERERSYDHTTTAEGKSKVGPYAKQTGEGEGTHDIRHGVYSRVTTTGWKASCECNAGIVPCVVLDPFGGAGTTGLVADRLGRNAVLCELNPTYAQMAADRIKNENPMFTNVEIANG
jgi:DNA modification methylase